MAKTKIYLQFLLAAGFLLGSFKEGSCHALSKRESPLFYEYLLEDKPNAARAKLGEEALLPCALNFHHDTVRVRWSRVEDSEVLVVSTTRVTDDSRFSGSYSADMSTFFLIINPVLEADEGDYQCFVMDTYPKEKTIVSLEVVEPSDDLRWNSDLKCSMPRIPGSIECDPEGAFPCCSAGGWCGFTDLHCQCEDCIDYRTEPGSNETLVAKRWRDDFRCGWNSEVNGEEAICNPDSTTNYCCSSHGWCGSGEDYCDCLSCIDYRDQA